MRLILSGSVVGFWALPVMFLVFLVPQSFIVSYFFSDYTSFGVLLISLLAVVCYLFGGVLAACYSRGRVLFVQGWRKTIFVGVFFVYFISYLGLYYFYGGVPLLDLILDGGNASVLRAKFYKDLEGFPQLLAYIRSILTRGFLPFAIVALFMLKGRFVFYITLFFITFLSLSAMEKSLLIWAYIPLLIYQYSINCKKDLFFCFFIAVFAFVFISMVSVNEPQGGYVYNSGSSQHSSSEWSFKTASSITYPASSVNASLVEKEDHQFILHDLREGTVYSYMLNRIVWIPFVTVYDTIAYWSATYDGFLLFSVNRHLSKVFGVKFADLEREVFRYQFGSGEESTGNANAAFIAEAYVGFGLAGVAWFSFFLGLIFGWVARAGTAPFVYSLPVIAVGLLSASFLSMLFSGGLVFFIIFFIFFSRSIHE